MNERTVVISSEQAQILEEFGERMMREHDDRAFKVLAIALAFRYAPFSCNIDESAGLAEVVDLHDYSRKVGA